MIKYIGNKMFIFEKISSLYPNTLLLIITV